MVLLIVDDIGSGLFGGALTKAIRKGNILAQSQRVQS